VTTEKSWFDSQQRQEIFRSSETSRPSLGPTQPIEEVPRARSPGIKRLERVSDHSHLALRVKMCGALLLPPPPHVVLMPCIGEFLHFRGGTE